MELFNMLKINIPVVFTHGMSWNQSVYLNEPNLNIGGILSMQGRLHLLCEHHMIVIPLWVCQEACAFGDHVCHKER